MQSKPAIDRFGSCPECGSVLRTWIHVWPCGEVGCRAGCFNQDCPTRPVAESIKGAQEALEALAKSKKQSGFSLIELLVVIAIISILAALLAPAINKARLRSQALSCQNNQRQLFLAWLNYSTDAGERLPLAENEGETTEERKANKEFTWVNSGSPFPNWQVRQSILQPYCRSVDIFRCPANKRDTNLSQAMNTYVGGVGRSGEFPHYTKLSQIDLGVFVFTDTRDDEIAFASFLTYMDEPAVGFFTIPASAHNRAGTFTFADGHSEIHRWKDQRTMPPITSEWDWGFESRDNVDAAWLQERATKIR